MDNDDEVVPVAGSYYWVQCFDNGPWWVAQYSGDAFYLLGETESRPVIDVGSQLEPPPSR